MNTDIINEGKRVFDIEIEALQKTRDALGEDFANIIEEIKQCTGKVIITGMGKPGHIARKMAATLSSLGTSSFCLHPAEALHGDLGMVAANDIVIAISYSGESEEITRILPNIKLIGAKIIAISGNPDSTLVKHSDMMQIFPPFEEACYMHLAPTSSTTATLVYGDALAVVASREYGFREVDYGLFHPAGSLGKKLLLKVSDIMKAGGENATVPCEASLKEAIIEMSKKAIGMVTVIHTDGTPAGIITDGDLRRQLEKGVDIYSLSAQDVMTAKPVMISEDSMAVDALKVLKQKNISSMPVTDDAGKVVGAVTLQAILHAGIVL